MKKIHKIVTCCLIGSMAYFGKANLAMGAEVPVTGINLVLHDAHQNNEKAQEIITEILQTEVLANVKGLSFAQVSNYVNIRSKPSENGEVLGKLYDNGAAEILDKSGDWYKVKSGSVEGYILEDFLITGEKASDLSKELGTKVASVTADTLRVRESASTNSSIVSLIPKGEKLVVKSEKNDWVKVSVGSSTGFVASDYVKLNTIYQEAVSIQEEQARIAEEARRISSNNNSSSKQSTYKATTKASTTTSTNTSLASKLVNYSLQFKGNPYKWGGTSLTYGADCSGFTQSIFKKYGISIPRTSRAQAASGKRVNISEIQKGDLVFYSKNGRINHVAIYIGNGNVISASSPKVGIKVADMYYRNPVKVVRYIS